MESMQPSITSPYKTKALPRWFDEHSYFSGCPITNICLSLNPLLPLLFHSFPLLSASRKVLPGLKNGDSPPRSAYGAILVCGIQRGSVAMALRVTVGKNMPKFRRGNY